MKKYLVFFMVLIISISPLFRGLFFPFEMYLSFAALSFLGGAYLISKYRLGEKFRIPGGVFFSSLIMLLAYLLAFAKAANPRGNIEMVMQLIVYMLIAFVLSDYFHDKKQELVKFFFLPLIFGGSLAAFLGLAGYTKVFTGLKDTINGNRIGSTLQYANTAAVYFLLILLMLIYFMVVENKTYYKVGAAALGHVLLMALFFTSSRGVFLLFPPMIFLIFLIVMPLGTKLKGFLAILAMSLPMIITMKPFNAAAFNSDLAPASLQLLFGATLSGVLFFLFDLQRLIQRRRRTELALIFLLGIILVVVAGVKGEVIITAINRFVELNVPKGVLDRMHDINLETKSVVMRFEFFREAWTLIKKRPLIGYGGYGFASLYQSVQNVYYAARLVHNHYLQVFVEAGIFGILGFIGTIVFGLFYYFYGRLREVELNKKTVAAVLFCSLLALSAHSAIDFNLSYSSMGYILFALTAVASIFGPKNKYLNREAFNFKKQWQILTFSVVLLTFLFSVPFSLAANQIEVGSKAKKQIVAVQAITAYEKAVRLDPLHAGPRAELADLYTWMANISRLEAEKQEWLQKAVVQAERSLKLDPHYPYYNRIAAKVYSSANMPLEAKERAEYLVLMQPLVKSNFEVLAKSYVEAAFAQVKNEDYKKAQESFLAALELIEREDLEANKTIIFYAGQAALALGKLDTAEALLTEAAAHSLNLRMDADRMLYLINQLKGREEENNKFQGLAWMGLVESTPLYRTLKSLNEKAVFPIE